MSKSKVEATSVTAESLEYLNNLSMRCREAVVKELNESGMFRGQEVPREIIDKINERVKEEIVNILACPVAELRASNKTDPYEVMTSHNHIVISDDLITPDEVLNSLKQQVSILASEDKELKSMDVKVCIDNRPSVCYPGMFRGKGVGVDEYYYGYYFRQCGPVIMDLESPVSSQRHLVHDYSIGEWSGLYTPGDRIPIFEGDIVKVTGFNPNDEYYGVVVVQDGIWSVKINAGESKILCSVLNHSGNFKILGLVYEYTPAELRKILADLSSILNVSRFMREKRG